MPHAFGSRARTRSLFSRPFGTRGQINMSNYLTSFKLGDFVDIVGNGAIHKGLPYKYYHGKTGRVWNITPRAVGVEVKKQVNGRIILKRIHVRIEHVRKSKCQADFLARIKANQEIILANKSVTDPAKKTPLVKRTAAQPRPGYLLRLAKQTVKEISPEQFVEVN
jgi:large subunit ribosomal protein L21e